MSLYLALLKAVGKAALNAVGGGVAGDLVCDVLPEVAQKVAEWWGKGKSPAQRQAALQALADAPPAEVERAVEQVVAEAARGQPPAVGRRLSIYLSLLPGAARASLRRGGPPEDEEDYLSLLPSHLPRFGRGDRPLAGIDWELVELLGAGGFGEVWKARNPHFDGVPPVALKFCLDPSAKDRLLRHEAAVLNQVMRQGSHPGIVRLRQTYLSADPPCLEYEYVSGGDLAGLAASWRRGGRPDVERVGRLMHELAGIIAFAHRLSPPIVHRDLKPANVLIAPPASGAEGFGLRVGDFGIGGLAASHARAASLRGVSRGDFLVSAIRGAHTPLYASVQQMRGDAPDVRDDVYSLGVIWFQLLMGDLTAARPGGSRWAARLAASGVPADQIELLSSCLEDDPADRPADAGVLAVGLAPPRAPAAPPPPEPKMKAAPAPAAKASVKDVEVPETCPDCGGAMKVRENRHGGYFLGCLAYPSCRGTRRPPPWLVELLSPEKAAERPAPPPPRADLPARLTNSLGMTFVLIPSGSFPFGSPADEDVRTPDEAPGLLAWVERPFYLAVHPVTQKAYESVMRSNPSHFHKKNGGGPEHPVEQVSWDDAVAFCEKLSGLADEKKAGRTYRLPGEKEWEHACRAGTATPFCFGASLSSEQANFDGGRPYGGAEPGPFRQKTTKVGSFAANAWGLYDVHGNVWEWTGDLYAAGATPRVLRGGSWNNSGHLCRSARRQKYPPNYRGDNVGFRVALEA